jgi:hypothetical protein
MSRDAIPISNNSVVVQMNEAPSCFLHDDIDLNIQINFEMDASLAFLHNIYSNLSKQSWIVATMKS